MVLSSFYRHIRTEAWESSMPWAMQLRAAGLISGPGPLFCEASTFTHHRDVSTSMVPGQSRRTHAAWHCQDISI